MTTYDTTDKKQPVATTVDPKAPVTPAQTGNLDAEKETVFLRAIAGVTKEWKAVCGSLLTDVDAPQNAPVVATFKQGAYQLLARRDGSGQAGLPSVKEILGLTKSRQPYFQALELQEGDAKQDQQRRDKVNDCLQDLEAGGDVRFNSDRVLAAYNLLTAGGRDWWKGDDAKDWVGKFAAYIQNTSLLITQVTPEAGSFGAPNAAIGRMNALKPLLCLLKTGALVPADATAPAAKTPGAATGPTDDQKKQWDTQAAALKAEIEPHLPPDGAVGKDAKGKDLDPKTRMALIAKISGAPVEVRDRISSDTTFMRRVALLGESSTPGRDANSGNMQVQTLFRALDPVEALADKCLGRSPNPQNGILQTERKNDGTSPLPPPDERFGYIRDFLLAHPGKEGQPLRLSVMTNANIKMATMSLSKDQQSDLWKLATRGSLDPAIEDRLYAAVKANSGTAAAQALLSASGEDRDHIKALQDDLVFRNAFATDEMRKDVTVNGVTVRPYDLLMLMWGLRPGDTKDPGQTGALENNPDDEQKPLNFEERQQLDRELYNPTIASLKSDLSAADSWFFAGARTSDSDVSDHLNAFATKCADPKYVGLIRRGGTPPGQELATKYNAATGQSIHALIKGGCGDEARRTAERVLNITIDSASVGVVGGGVARAGDGPDAAPMKLEQALRETTIVDNGPTVTQVVHDSAQKLRDELHEGLFWNGADVPDIKVIWDELKGKVDPKLASLEKLTKRKVWTIELLQNAYQEIDGPLMASLDKNLGDEDRATVKAYVGLTGGDISKRAKEAAAGPVDQKAAARQQAETIFGGKSQELFDAFAGLKATSGKEGFEGARTKMAAYLVLVSGAPTQTAPAGGPPKDTRVSKEIAPDLAPGAGVVSPENPEDFYRVKFGLTPHNHAIQVARACRKLSNGQAFNNNQDTEGAEEHSPEEVAEWLGIEKSLVGGAVARPPDTEKPVIDERNDKLVRPGFTVETATKNAADMWKLLHEGGEVHLIQTMLYGAYNDEEQRLIRLAFRQLSGGIDWQFYVQQAKYQTNHNGNNPEGGADNSAMAVGAEGTDAGKQVSDKQTVNVVANAGELDTAIAVATQGELDIRDELRSAASHSNVNEIFRICDRADDAQCRQVLADTDLVAKLKGVCDSSAWDRVYRVLTGQDSLNDRLESRAHGDRDSFWENTFGGTDEKGMKEDIKVYVHRMHEKFEAEEMKKAKSAGQAPQPELIQLLVARRLREACRQLASNPETNAILESELSGTDLSGTRGQLMNGGEDSNVGALAGGGSGDEVIAEIKKMPKAERERRLADPEYMQRLTKQLSATDLQMAISLLQSTAVETPVMGETAPPDQLQDKLAEIAKLVAPGGTHDLDDILAKLVSLNAKEHDRLIADPKLCALVLAPFKFSEEKLEIAQRVIGFRKENADNILGPNATYPDAQPGTCDGRTLPDAEKQRLAYLQANAVARLQQGSTVSWNILLQELVEVYKLDLKPHDIKGNALNAPVASTTTPASQDPSMAPNANPNADAVAKVELTIRTAIFDQAKPAMVKRADDDTKLAIAKDAVLGTSDPSSWRVKEQWGTFKDNSDGVTDTLTNASDDKLIQDWTSVTKHKANDSGSLEESYQKYRAAFDAAGGEKQEDSPAQKKLQEAKLAFMNYVVDISVDFEMEVLPNAGTNFLGLGADQDGTKKGEDRSRTKARENKEYNQWRALIRSRIPNLPKEKIASAIHANDRPADVAMIVNPNRSFQESREFREDEYLQKMGTDGAGMRVANAERATVNDSMTRYEREAGIAETNELGGYGVVTTEEGAKVEKTGAEVDRAMREFTAARAKIASMAGAIVGLIAGAAITVLTGGAGAGIAWMLVAGAISGAAGAAGSAIAQKAVQGADFEMSHEGLQMIAEGAISGMVFAGTTRLAQNIMSGLAGPASLKAQAELMETIMKEKPTVWAQILAGAKGTAQASGEMVLSDGMAAAIDAGLVPLDPSIWMHGWDEGVINSRHKVREKLTGLDQRLLTDAILGALTHNVRTGVNAVAGKDAVVPLTVENKAKVKTFMERVSENSKQYMKVDEWAIQTFSTFAANRLGEAAFGKSFDWSTVPEQLFKDWITTMNGIAPGVHANADQLGARRVTALENELRDHGAQLTEAEKAHYKAINPEYAPGDIITVQAYLTARQGMFEGRTALWEQQIHRELTPGERAAFQKYCREAADSTEYQERLNTNPLTIKAVQEAGFMAKKGDDAAGTDHLNDDKKTTKTDKTTTTEPPVDKTVDKTKTDPKVVDPNTNNADGKSTDPKTADDFAKVTGTVEAMDGNFQGKARKEGEPDKLADAIRLAMPQVAAQFKGEVEVVGSNQLKVKIGDKSFVVTVVTMGAEGTDVARYRFTGPEGAIIEISDRARDKHVERAVADLIAEMQATREAQLAGKELPKENALGDNAKGTELSAQDIGRIAQLKALLRQLAQAENPGDGMNPNPVVVKQLNNDITHLLEAMGLENGGTKTRNELVESKLTGEERNQLAVRNDDGRREAADAKLGPHAGVEVHNHFLGVVQPEAFADASYAAEKARLEADAKKTGKPAELPNKSGWELCLDRIASMDSIAHKNTDGSKHERGKDFDKRGTSGDAVALAKLTKQVVEGTVTVVPPEAKAPAWLEQGASNLAIARSQLEAAKRGGDPVQIEAAEAEVAKQKAELARAAVNASLTATDETDFNSSYEVRDVLIKDTMGGTKAADLRAQLAEEQAKDPKDAAKIKDLQNKVEGAAYDDIARQTVRALIKDGLIYNEQSNSLKKLNERFTKPVMDKVIWDVSAEMLANGEITEGQALQLRQLTMVLTGFFGTEETRKDEASADENDQKAKNKGGRTDRFNDKAWDKTKADLNDQLGIGKDGELKKGEGGLEGRSDIMGIDIAGPETARFDELGQQRFQDLYRMLKDAAKKRGRPLVLRPHVGEGFTDTEAGSEFNKNETKQKGDQAQHYDRSRKNLDALLDAIEALGKELDPQLVTIRFGHATHATADQAERMAKLGIIAEVNLHSNIMTGSLDQSDPNNAGKSQAQENYDDHALLTFILLGTQTILSTDAHSVMDTNMKAEYERAQRIIEEFLAGSSRVRVSEGIAKGRGEKVVHNAGTPDERVEYLLARGDLTPEELGRFLHGYESLNKWATDYKNGVAAGDKTDKLLWNDLFQLVSDPETKTDPGKRLHERDLLRRLAMTDGTLDTKSLEFGAQLDASKIDAVKKAALNLTVESDGAKSVERWQTHGLEDNPKASEWLKEPAFVEAYKEWIELPDRVVQGPDGTWKANHLDSVPPEFRDRIEAIVKGGNVTLMHQATGTATTLAESFPELAKMDPKSPEYQAKRAELVARFGEEQVAKFEQSVTGAKGDPKRAELDARVSSIIDDSTLEMLKAKFPGCEVFLTGSATQLSKGLEKIMDLDLIVMAPADMSLEKRVELEQAIKGLKVPTSAAFAEQTKRSELDVDAKVMTPREMFGLATQKTPSGRTPMEYLRVDTDKHEGPNEKLAPDSKPIDDKDGGRARLDRHETIEEFFTDPNPTPEVAALQEKYKGKNLNNDAVAQMDAIRDIKGLQNQLVANEAATIPAVTSAVKAHVPTATEAQLREVFQYLFNSSGIAFTYPNYVAWVRMSQGRATVDDIRFMVHELHELKTMKDDGFADPLGKAMAGKQGTPEFDAWDDKFNAAYLKAHSSALRAEADFVAKEVGRLTDGEVALSTEECAASDRDRREQFEIGMEMDGKPFKDHPSYATWNRGTEQVTLTDAVAKRLKLPKQTKIEDVIRAVKQFAAAPDTK